MPGTQRWKCCLFAFGGLVAIASQFSAGQQIGISTPMTSVSDGYFERQGVSFGANFGSPAMNGSSSSGFFNFGGPSFNQGSFGSAIPAFGGYVPGTGAQFGFSNRNGNGSGFSLGFEMAKGSSRSVTSVVPSVTVPNGYGGSIGDLQMQPFVTSITPIIGSYEPPLPNAVTLAMASGQLDLSGLGRHDTNRALDSEVVSALKSPMVSTAMLGESSIESIVAEKAEARAKTRSKVDDMVARAQLHLNEQEIGLARILLKRAMVLEQDKARRTEIRELLDSIGR